MRVETGIHRLDNMMEGGIPRGNVVLVSGEYGTGKTTLSLHFVGDGVEDYGEFGVFVTFEEGRDSILRTGEDFGLSLKRWEKSGSLKILEVFQDSYKDLDDAGDAVVDDILEAVEGMDADRVVVDGLAELRNFFETKRGLVSSLSKLRRELRSRGCTSIVTSPLDFDIENLVDGVIVLHYDGEIEKERFIEVRKMRGTSHSKSLYPFEIRDEGIFILNLRNPRSFSEDLSRFKEVM